MYGLDCEFKTHRQADVSSPGLAERWKRNYVTTKEVPFFFHIYSPFACECSWYVDSYAFKNENTVEVCHYNTPLNFFLRGISHSHKDGRNLLLQLSLIIIHLLASSSHNREKPTLWFSPVQVMHHHVFKRPACLVFGILPTDADIPPIFLFSSHKSEITHHISPYNEIT